MDVLNRIGFEDREVSVYQALLADQDMSVSDISRTTGLNRPAIYQALFKLTKRNLVSTLPKGKYKIYRAEEPERLRELYERTGRLLSKKIGELEETKHLAGNSLEVEYVKGKPNIRKFYDRLFKSLNKGDTYYRYATDEGSKRMRDRGYIAHSTVKMIDGKNFERQIITNQKVKDRKSPKLGRQIRVVPHGQDPFDYDQGLEIFGNRVVITDFNSDTLICITNEKFANFQRNLFKIVFNSLKP